MTGTLELYAATRTLFRAFHYLQPRMRGGSFSPYQPMNGEALAGCVLHNCMSRVLRELQEQRLQSPRAEFSSDWIALPHGR